MTVTYGLHTAIGSLHHHADRIIALTDFGRDQFIRAGFPEDKLVVKPNFFEDATDASPWGLQQRSGFLFVGRISEEKGPDVFVATADLMRSERFEMLGDGPLLQGMALPGNVFAPGSVGKAHVLDAMQRTVALVMPSRWYEGLPMVLVEAFRNGLPVIASRLGAFLSLIEDGVTGLLFDPGDAQDLARKVQWCRDHPEAVTRMGVAARAEYLRRYTAQSNYEQMLHIYHAAIQHRQAR